MLAGSGTGVRTKASTCPCGLEPKPMICPASLMPIASENLHPGAKTSELRLEVNPLAFINAPLPVP